MWWNGFMSCLSKLIYNHIHIYIYKFCPTIMRYSFVYEYKELILT